MCKYYTTLELFREIDEKGIRIFVRTVSLKIVIIHVKINVSSVN